MMKIAALLGLFIGLLSSVWGQSFSGTFTFGGNGNTNSFPYNGTAISQLTVGNLNKVGVTTTSSSGNFRASNWALDSTPGSLAGSVDFAKYFDFTLTAEAGYSFDMGGFDFGVGRSATGPRSFEWRSSADNYGAVISGYTSVNAALNENLGAGILSYTSDATTSATGNILSFSGSSMTNLTSVTFRFYAYNSENAGGTGGLQGDFTFSGSLNVPLGTTYVWSGGSGSWGNGQPGNFDQTFISADDALVEFGGAAGTVTVDGAGVETGSMNFLTSGYSVVGEAFNLAQGIIDVESGTVSVASEIVGGAGLIKRGSGTLTLSGSNSFSGAVSIAEGTLSISSDAALGDTANDLVLSGTLMTTASLSLDSGRNVSGGGTLDIADETVLTVPGAFSNSTTTLTGAGTLDLQGAVRQVGLMTVNAPATIDSVGAINANGLTAPNLTSGTAAINPDVVFTSGDKTLNVGAGGTMELKGNLSNGGGAGRLIKTGAGTLVITGDNNMGGLRVGAAGGSPTQGGTVILENSIVGSQSQAIQLQSGRLSAATSLVFTSGISLAGRTNGVAALDGDNMEFQGQSGFFRGSGTSGALLLEVNNTTAFSGGFGGTSGGGTASGITMQGSGEVIISGNSSALTDHITLTDTIKLTLNNVLGGGVSVGSGNTLAGAGTIGGDLRVASGAKFVLSLDSTMTVNGALVSFADFGVTDLVGLDINTPVGSYTIFGGTATIDTNGLRNFGAANAFVLGDGKSAYFSEGSLKLNVVPEPSTYALLALSAAGLGARIFRRRCRP